MHTHIALHKNEIHYFLIPLQTWEIQNARAFAHTSKRVIYDVISPEVFVLLSSVRRILICYVSLARYFVTFIVYSFSTLNF